ncbi:MAG: phosphate signaling complex protein PhoU [Methanobacteriota archaeon]
MVREAFDRKLASIREDVLKMGSYAKDCVLLSVQSLKEQNLELVEKICKIEEESDLLNFNVEERCLKLAALQQPVARDMRFIATMINISGNFERICDLSVKITEITRKTIGRPLLKPLIDIPRMAETVGEMLDIDLEAIAQQRSVAAEELAKRDDFIDSLYQQVYNELLTFMMKDPRSIDDATDLLFVAIYLERIGDIVAKTGARVIYMVEGKRVWIK